MKKALDGTPSISKINFLMEKYKIHEYVMKEIEFHISRVREGIEQLNKKEENDIY